MSLPIHRTAQTHPDHLAFMHREHEIRYADLAAALSTNSVMRLKNVSAGDHLAWCAHNDLDSFLTFWAMQQRGLVACPISHRFPLATRSDVVARIDAAWLPDWIENDSEGREIDESGIDRDLDGPATLLLSSGSTGAPKAIVHAMEAHVASAKGASVNMPLGPGDRWLWSLPLFHISGLSILVRCAFAGATVVGQEPDSGLSASVLEELQITHLSVVSTQLRRLMGEDGFPSKHLKSVLLGGSRVDPKLVSRARRRGVNVMTTYGLTETASQVTTSTNEDDPESSGRLLPERELRISNDGEILVRGSTLCLGYYGNGTIQSVVDHEGWFHTKDLGTLDETGLLRVRGRIDNMFISGGENIYPENIERAMLAAFEIQQVVVVPKLDRLFGSRPVAFVAGGLPPNWETTLRKALKGFEIPVEIHDWPAAAATTMKVDRKWLQSLLAD